MFKKRRAVAPFFKVPPPFNPFTGNQAAIGVPVDKTRIAMFQVIAEDTHDNYLVCRGFDPEVGKFFNTVNVAKAYGARGQFDHVVGEVFPAAKPKTVLGDTPGVCETTVGQPADLDETIVILRDDAGVAIAWIELAGGGQTKRCSAVLTADAAPGATVNVDNVVPLDGGGSPLDDPDDATETLSVTMPPDARALDNAPCEIKWDENADAWKITWVHQQAQLIRGTLGGALTTTTASQTISSPVSMDRGQVPTGTLTAYNEYTTKGMSGPSGAECMAVWNESHSGGGEYEFFWVEGIVQTVVTDYQIDTGTFKFQKKTRSLVGWWDGDESSWTDVHTGDDCS